MYGVTDPAMSMTATFASGCLLLTVLFGPLALIEWADRRARRHR